MSDLTNGLDYSAMIAAVTWEIVNYTYLRTVYFSERPSEEVFVKLTNEFIRARQAIYHGKMLEELKQESGGDCYQPDAVRYWWMAWAACRPAPMAEITVAPPVTISPPAKTPFRPV